jgi:hypothetical protein
MQLFSDYGPVLILCKLLPGKGYTGSGSKPFGYDSKLVKPDHAGMGGWFPIGMHRRISLAFHIVSNRDAPSDFFGHP